VANAREGEEMTFAESKRRRVLVLVHAGWRCDKRKLVKSIAYGIINPTNYNLRERALLKRGKR
jgi:hypothetical protein